MLDDNYASHISNDAHAETLELIEHIEAFIVDAMMQNCEDFATKRACPHFAELKKILDSWWNRKAFSQLLWMNTL